MAAAGGAEAGPDFCGADAVAGGGPAGGGRGGCIEGPPPGPHSRGPREAAQRRRRAQHAGAQGRVRGVGVRDGWP